jgi:uncharacterized protein (DUF169 family)
MKQITVLAATTQESLERSGADVEQTHCETIAEAKRRARYYLTDDYRIACESTVLLGYAQVLVNGKCHSDFFSEVK